jgi:hypothetical protein
MKAAWTLTVVAAVSVALVSIAVLHNAALAMEAANLTPLKDKVMEYIASNHADAEVFIIGISLTYNGGGTFSGGGWVLTLSGSIMSGSASADFSVVRTQNSSGIPHRILWSGTISNGTVIETSYTHAV